MGGFLGGAIAGIAVILIERALFRAPESWKLLSRSGRFFRYAAERIRGRKHAIPCPECWSTDTELRDQKIYEEPNVRGRIEMVIHDWYRCRRCGHRWDEEMNRSLTGDDIHPKA